MNNDLKNLLDGMEKQNNKELAKHVTSVASGCGCLLGLMLVVAAVVYWVVA